MLRAVVVAVRHLRAVAAPGADRPAQHHVQPAGRRDRRTARARTRARPAAPKPAPHASVALRLSAVIRRPTRRGIYCPHGPARAVKRFDRRQQRKPLAADPGRGDQEVRRRPGRRPRGARRLLRVLLAVSAAARVRDRARVRAAAAIRARRSRSRTRCSASSRSSAIRSGATTLQGHTFALVIGRRDRRCSPGSASPHAAQNALNRVWAVPFKERPELPPVAAARADAAAVARRAVPGRDRGVRARQRRPRRRRC